MEHAVVPGYFGACPLYTSALYPSPKVAVSYIAACSRMLGNTVWLFPSYTSLSVIFLTSIDLALNTITVPTPVFPSICHHQPYYHQSIPENSIVLFSSQCSSSQYSHHTRRMKTVPPCTLPFPHPLRVYITTWLVCDAQQRWRCHIPYPPP